MRASVHVDLPGWTKEGLPALKVCTTHASSIHSNLLYPLPTVHFFILSPPVHLLIITIIECIFSVLQKRCEELHIQPRGTRGESGGQTGGDNIQCSTVVYRIAILSGTFDRRAFPDNPKDGCRVRRTGIRPNFHKFQTNFFSPP